MKSISKMMALAAAAAVFAMSCTGVTPDDEPDGTEVPGGSESEKVIDASAFLRENSSAGLTVSASTTVFQIGVDTAYFVIRDDGKIVSEGYSIYESGSGEPLNLKTVKARSAEGAIYDIPFWVPSAPDTKSFWVTYKTQNTKAAPVRITALDIAVPSRVEDPDKDSKSFRHRAFVMDFTGVGCGYCPYMIATIDHLIEEEGAEFADKAVVAEIHTYSSGSLTPRHRIDSYLGVRSYPTLVIDYSRSLGNYSYSANVDNLTKVLNSALSVPAKAGISASYEVSDNTLVARATVKAAATGKYKVGMWLLEDGIYAKQSNYGMEEAYPRQFNNHDDVLRYADSQYVSGNFSGHDLGTIQEGEYADHVFMVELSGSWVKDNCHLVFFVTDAGDKDVIVNSAGTKGLSGKFAFEYE